MRQRTKMEIPGNHLIALAGVSISTMLTTLHDENMQKVRYPKRPLVFRGLQRGEGMAALGVQGLCGRSCEGVEREEQRPRSRLQAGVLPGASHRDHRQGQRLGRGKSGEA